MSIESLSSGVVVKAKKPARSKKRAVEQAQGPDGLVVIASRNHAFGLEFAKRFRAAKELAHG